MDYRDRQIAQLTSDLEEARDWVRQLTRENILTCVYCGHAYPPGTPSHGSDVLTAHIEQCEKHPMTTLRRELADAQAKLADVRNLHGCLGCPMVDGVCPHCGNCRAP